jgi:hypothetical protein
MRKVSLIFISAMVILAGVTVLFITTGKLLNNPLFSTFMEHQNIETGCFTECKNNNKPKKLFCIDPFNSSSEICYYYCTGKLKNSCE